VAIETRSEMDRQITPICFRYSLVTQLITLEQALSISINEFASLSFKNSLAIIRNIQILLRCLIESIVPKYTYSTKANQGQIL